MISVLMRGGDSARVAFEVSTGSGSDRVICPGNSTVAGIETRSLPLPVPTASPGRLTQVGQLQANHHSRSLRRGTRCQARAILDPDHV